MTASFPLPLFPCDPKGKGGLSMYCDRCGLILVTSFHAAGAARECDSTTVRLRRGDGGIEGPASLSPDMRSVQGGREACTCTT